MGTVLDLASVRHAVDYLSSSAAEHFTAVAPGTTAAAAAAASRVSLATERLTNELPSSDVVVEAAAASVRRAARCARHDAPFSLRRPRSSVVLAPTFVEWTAAPGLARPSS